VPSLTGFVVWVLVCLPRSGVGFAPCKPEAREKLIEVLEGVEDIPGSALHEGIQWSWESFPEYLETLSANPTACDFAVLLPHVPLRVYVMGDRCDDAPTSEDLDHMRQIVAEAMQAGAIGLSTSRTLLHRDLNGTVIPGTYADRAELTALMAGMADGGGGLFEILEDFADLDVEQDWLSKLSQNFGIPVSFAFAAGNKARQLEFNAFLDRVNKDSPMHGGEYVTGQTSIKNQGKHADLSSCAPSNPCQHGASSLTMCATDARVSLPHRRQPAESPQQVSSIRRPSNLRDRACPSTL
jgi:N-acyl-D-amino-acid deacylase